MTDSVARSVAIPAVALDDRLAFVGTSGSGKTYAAGTAVERLAAEKKRFVIVDPLGVWWGLRLLEDGKTSSRWPVVIFGGAHGDLALNDRAGALIGEAVAGTSESCIVDLSGLGTKSAERKFMLGFLEALYRKASGEPFHLIVDEADLFAPQKSSEPMLQSLMENIVRRGRVKGFIPWLLTQRPAVISKDVLSQADGLVAMKLTSSQDRDALGGWIEGQADRSEEKRILAALPQLEVGSGFVWLPGRQLLEQVTFPRKATFDSSRTPKRGEKRVTRELVTRELVALKGKLAKVEEEAKANDPAELRRQIADLRKKVSAVPIPAALSPKALEDAEKRGFERGWHDGEAATFSRFEQSIAHHVKRLVDNGNAAAAAADYVAADAKDVVNVLDHLRRGLGKTKSPATFMASTLRTEQPQRRAENKVLSGAVARLTPAPRGAAPTGVTGPQQKVLEALAMWKALGKDRPTRPMVANAAGYSPNTGNFRNILAGLAAAGTITYPEPGLVELMSDVAAIDVETAKAQMLGRLTGPERKLVDALAAAGALSRADLATATDYSANTGNFRNIISGLKTLELVAYPSTGKVALEAWVFDLL